LAQEVHEVCPNAWIINFTNPAGIVTEALLKHSPHKKIIGVCNIPYNMRHSSAEILDADPNDILIEFIGLNHFVFGRNGDGKGENRNSEDLNNVANDELDYSPADIISVGWSITCIE